MFTDLKKVAAVAPPPADAMAAPHVALRDIGMGMSGRRALLAVITTI